MIPAVVTFVNVIKENNFDNQSQLFLKNELQGLPNYDFLVQTAVTDFDNNLEITINNYGQKPVSEEVISILKNKFNLDDSQVNILLEIADNKNQEMISLYDWTSKINEVYKYNEKKALIRELWDVAFADGRIDKYEDHTIRKIADLIYVKHEDFMKAKHR